MGTRSPSPQRPFSNAANLSVQQSTPSIFHDGFFPRLFGRLGSVLRVGFEIHRPAFSHEPFIKSEVRAVNSADAYPPVRMDFIRSLVFAPKTAAVGDQLGQRITRIATARPLLALFI